MDLYRLISSPSSYHYTERYISNQQLSILVGDAATDTIVMVSLKRIIYNLKKDSKRQEVVDEEINADWQRMFVDAIQHILPAE